MKLFLIQISCFSWLHYTKQIDDSLWRKYAAHQTSHSVLVQMIYYLDLAVQLTAQGKGSFFQADPTFRPWSKLAERAGLQKIATR